MIPKSVITYAYHKTFKSGSNFKGISLIGPGGKIGSKSVDRRSYYSYVFFNTKTEKKLASFFLYPDGEWILMRPDGYFDISKNGRKHLKMWRVQDVRKKSVPINDRTYKKYKKTIDLKKIP